LLLQLATAAAPGLRLLLLLCPLARCRRGSLLAAPPRHRFHPVCHHLLVSAQLLMLAVCGLRLAQLPLPWRLLLLHLLLLLSLLLLVALLLHCCCGLLLCLLRLPLP
jgi:hypothetical protein